MMHSGPRERDRPVRLHGLYALMLAASVAIGAIAAAVALLDASAQPAGAGAATQTPSTSADDAGETRT